MAEGARSRRVVRRCVRELFREALCEEFCDALCDEVGGLEMDGRDGSVGEE